METSETSKRSKPRKAARSVQNQVSTRKKRESGRTMKMRLLLFLLGILAILFVLHIIVVYAQSPALQPTTCDQLIEEADYPQEVHLQPDTQEMEAVQMVKNLDDGTPAALVQVITHGSPETLDVYVFGCTMQQNQPHLSQLFLRQGLVNGSVELTPHHTILVENLDTRLAPNTLPFLLPLQQNIYQEYTWQHNAFTQVHYPGFYPVSSRAEAEQLQQSASDGQSLPWNDPITTALQMSRDLLHWTPDPQSQLVSQSAGTSIVQLTRQSPHTVLRVTLKQLIQPNASGLWFVTDARTKGIIVTQANTLNRPLLASQNSPLQFSGANALVDGQTSATLFDHTMTPVEQASNRPVTVHSDSSYSGSLPYTNLLSGQQGVLLISSMPHSENLNTESGQVILTGVLLN